jgi:geranylgeranyl diphosphate synthase type I
LASHTTEAQALSRAVDIMQAAGSMEYSSDYAFSLVSDAKDELIAVLPPSNPRQLLLSMADFFVDRMS